MKEITKTQSIPGLLGHIPDPPKALYMQGDPSLASRTDILYICIVGPRKSSPYGQEVVRYIIEHLSQMNIVTVSGAAYGIDAIVHSLSIKHSIPTIAVPGSGISDESFYPRAHLDLKHDIIDAGGLIMSEFDPLSRADVWTFPIRNRIMAGMSHLTIIVEAEKRSGTLITANLAIDYNREVLAVPGSIFSSTSVGTHELISKGAELFVNTETLTDILTRIADKHNIILWKDSEKMHVTDNVSVAPIQKTKIEDLSPEEQKVYTCIQSYSDGTTKEQISSTLSMTSTEVSIFVSMLELHNLIRFHMGKIWVKY